MSKLQTDPGQLAVDCVRSLSPYVPGKPIEELQRELGLTDIIKLASNENPYGASPHALAAMQRALGEAWLYPDGSGHVLKNRLAAKLGLDVAQITLGNGSNDLLVLLAEAFLRPGLEAIYSQYAFAVYPIAVQATGASGVVTPANPPDSAMPLGHDLAAMARAITSRTRLIFIANPNNPTGTWVPASGLKSFLASVPSHALVALDEAYFEYTDGLGLQDGIQWLAEFPNLVVLRTFSKAYGLAGLRVGYALAHPSVADVMNRVRQPFNVNSVALAAATAALDDMEFVARSYALNLQGMKQIEEGARALGLNYIPSHGNFITVRVGKAPEIYKRLLKRGVIVRPVGGGYGLNEHLRVTVGTAAENERFLGALAASLKE